MNKGINHLNNLINVNTINSSEVSELKRQIDNINEQINNTKSGILTRSLIDKRSELERKLQEAEKGSNTYKGGRRKSKRRKNKNPTKKGKKKRKSNKKSIKKSMKK